MAYNDYEDYMREVLGYTAIHNSCNTCGNNSNYYNNMQMPNYSMKETLDIEQMYPEIYKAINPMVCKMCDENTEQITEDLVSRMTDKIYNTVVSNIETGDIININIETRDNEAEDRSVENDIVEQESSKDNADNRVIQGTNDNNHNNKANSNTGNIARMNSRFNVNMTNKGMQIETRQLNENARQPSPARPIRPQNQLLRDLIRILILNRLFNRNRPPMRPPMPPRPRMDLRYEPWFENGY